MNARAGHMYTVRRRLLLTLKLGEVPEHVPGLRAVHGYGTPPADHVDGGVIDRILRHHGGAIRVARENGFLTAKVQLSNITSSNQMMYYRFAWLGADGFPVGEEETWKVLNLYANQATFLPAIANLPQAADFRLEVKTP